MSHGSIPWLYTVLLFSDWPEYIAVWAVWGRRGYPVPVYLWQWSGDPGSRPSPGADSSGGTKPSPWHTDTWTGLGSWCQTDQYSPTLKANCSLAHCQRTRQKVICIIPTYCTKCVHQISILCFCTKINSLNYFYPLNKGYLKFPKNLHLLVHVHITLGKYITSSFTWEYNTWYRLCTHLDASTDRTLVTMDRAIMICMVEVILYRDILRSSPVLM